MEPLTILAGLAALTTGLALTSKKGSSTFVPDSSLSIGAQVRIGDQVMVGPAFVFPLGLPFDINTALRDVGGPMVPGETIREVELLITNVQEANGEIQGVTTGFILDGKTRTVFVAVPERIPTKFFSRGAVLSATRNGQPIIGKKPDAVSGIGAVPDRRGRFPARRSKNFFRRYAETIVLPYWSMTQSVSSVVPRCKASACGLWRATGVVAANSVPSSMALVQLLPQNSIVTILNGPYPGTVNGRVSNWLFVRTPANLTGWIDATEVSYL